MFFELINTNILRARDVGLELVYKYGWLIDTIQIQSPNSVPVDAGHCGRLGQLDRLREHPTVWATILGLQIIGYLYRKSAKNFVTSKSMCNFAPHFCVLARNDTKKSII